MNQEVSDEDRENLEKGFEFLLGKGLLAEADVQNGVYGVTHDGLCAVYLLSLVMASGVVSREVKGTPQEADARQVAQSATALVRALDEIGMEI